MPTVGPKEVSPFTPGSPVPVELFAGRAQQIQEVDNYLKQTASGSQENVFLTGDRGNWQKLVRLDCTAIGRREP